MNNELQSIWHTDFNNLDMSRDELYMECKHTPNPFDKSTKSSSIVAIVDILECPETFDWYKKNTIRWCYTSDLLSESEENDRLKKALDIAKEMISRTRMYAKTIRPETLIADCEITLNKLTAVLEQKE